jgi:hypothetical protein
MKNKLGIKIYNRSSFEYMESPNCIFSNKTTSNRWINNTLYGMYLHKRKKINF